MDIGDSAMKIGGGKPIRSELRSRSFELNFKKIPTSLDAPKLLNFINYIKKNMSQAFANLNLAIPSKLSL